MSNVSRFCGQPAILAAVAPRAEPEVGREIRLVRSPRHQLSVADRAVMNILLHLAIEETRKEGGSLRPIARLSGKRFPDLESRKSVAEKSGHHAIGL